MNALILSCNTGEGHNSCARAIKDCFERHGDSCRIEDALGFISKGASRFISRWHVRMYRHMPWLFRLGYRFSENHPGRLDDGTLPYRFIGEGTEALCRYIIQNHIDTVICPHVFSAIMVTELREKYPSLQFKSCFIATDYTCSPGTESISTDLFFVPDKSVVDNDLLVSPEQVLDSGMPVRACFYESAGKKQAREQLGYDAEGRHLLMMCGSMGCGPMKELASLLASRLREGQTLTIVCGTNKKLFRWMNKNFHGRRDIHVIEYTNDISLLMDSADLYLTKPGGLSTSEAAVKDLPMCWSTRSPAVRSTISAILSRPGWPKPPTGRRSWPICASACCPTLSGWRPCVPPDNKSPAKILRSGSTPPSAVCPVKKKG